MEERWWSAPLEGDDGHDVIVTGRDNLDKVRNSGKFPYLIKVSWHYHALSNGFPEEADEKLMGCVHDAFVETFHKDKTAYLVAVYTGDGCRDWIFYASNLNIFNKVFNRALADIEETIPFEIEALQDPDWEEYAEMRTLSYIPPEEE